MEIKVGCLIDHYDLRDYTLQDALKALGQDTSEVLSYAIFEYEAQKEQVVFCEDGKEESFNPAIHGRCKVFDKFPIKKVSSCTQNLTSCSVFIPLKPQPRLGVLEGKLVLVDSQNQPVGNLVLDGDQIVVRYRENQAPLTVEPGKDGLYVYLGAGSRKYELEAHHWSPVEQQGESPTLLGGRKYYPDPMCGANAGVALLEYFERAAEGRHLDASRLFLHQVACQLMHVEPTSGVSVRAIVKAIAEIGVPPEEYWPYDLSKLENKEDPPSLCYAYARNYRATSYLSLDRPGIEKNALIAQIKIFIYSGLPIMFGFSIYESIEQSFEDEEGKIPFPTYGEVLRAGHAAVIVGYDDEVLVANLNPIGERDRWNNLSGEAEDQRKTISLKNQSQQAKKISNRRDYGRQLLDSLKKHEKENTSIALGEVVIVKQGETEVLITKGAFKIRNSWGREWGEEGYGWLPYAYIFQDQAFDFWTVLKFDWMHRKDFGLIHQRDRLVVCGLQGKDASTCMN